MATDLKILQTLTDTAVDSVKGYEKAAQRATDPQLKTRSRNKRPSAARPSRSSTLRSAGLAANPGPKAAPLVRLTRLGQLGRCYREQE